MGRKQAISAQGLPQPYADMVGRIHEFCISLIGQAQAGNVCGVLVEAERLAKQTGSLVDLLNMKGEKNEAIQTGRAFTHLVGQLIGSDEKKADKK